MYPGERFNAYSHLVGAVLAVIGTVMLLQKAGHTQDVYKIISSTAYGVCLILLYMGSTIYHSTRHPGVKGVLQKFDHCAIYLLIAGSYTPFCLVSLRGPWGCSLFAAVWSLALIGMLQEIKPRSEARVLSLIIYAVMGWIVLVAVKPLIAALGMTGFKWLAAGGVLYTVGIIFFAYDSRFRHWHGIWHLFVMAGSLLHFVAILLYVL